jgi:ABC-type multidrug transport system fused ATPase/permease subunit
MGWVLFAIGVEVLAFCAGILGLTLHRWLPERHAPEQSREMIGAVTGLLGLLLALVLGTLVGSAYTLYSTQKSELETLAARTLQLAAAFEAFGPEAEPGRVGLRKALQQSYDAIWGAHAGEKTNAHVKDIMDGLKMLGRFLVSLDAKTDAQKQALATANLAAQQIAQTRILMVLQLAAAISWPLVAIVVCWALLLFCGYGLVSPLNATVVTTLAFGAVAVASAIFVIIELSQPCSGLFRIPSSAVVEAMRALAP